MVTHLLMLKDNPVLRFNIDEGIYELCDIHRLPLNLPLVFEEQNSLTTMRHNDNAMQRWCAERTLSMSQKHAKAIRNVLSLTQDDSDYNRCRIALSYRCLSLDDSYWVKRITESITWADVNLFDNPSRNALTPVSLKGDMSTIFNEKLKNSSDLGVDGTFAKSWVREEDGTLYLLKADDDTMSTETLNEVCASKVLDCFNILHAEYTLSEYDGVRVSKSKIFTNGDYSLVKYKALYKQYGVNGENTLERVKVLFPVEYAKLCVATYLIGNEDLHTGNWGFIQDADNGNILGLAPLYDFNYAFTRSYLKGHREFPFAPESVYVTADGKEIYDSRLLDDFDVRVRKGRSLEIVACEAMKTANLVQTKIVTEDMFTSVDYFNEFKRRCAVLGFELNSSIREPVWTEFEYLYLNKDAKKVRVQKAFQDLETVMKRISF